MNPWSPSAPESPPHTLTPEDAGGWLHSSPVGLTEAEAARRRAEVGPNELRAASRFSPLALLAEQFQNVLIVVLLVAVVLSFVLGHTLEAVAIVVIVLFAVALGFVQEFRAERALEALHRLAAPKSTVFRDGEPCEVPARELVPGDVVLLTAGNRVPADGRLLEAHNLQVQEAALTGESLPVEKCVEALPDPALPVGDRRNMVFAGTTASYGRARVLVVATGMATEFGKLAQLLETVEAGRTPLQENLDELGHTLARAALVLVAGIVALGWMRGQPLLEMLVFGIALAVAVVPEGLPAVVTISLALGVQRLVKRGALIRRLPAIETLGSTTVICSDKTGTLTKDEMTATRVFVAGSVLCISGDGYEPEGEFTCGGVALAPSAALLRLLRAASLSSDVSLVFDREAVRWEVRGDPTEAALVVAAAKAGCAKATLDAAHPRLDEVPFDSTKKRMTTLHQVDGEVWAFAKGAPEVILAACTKILGAEGELPLDEAGRAEVLAAFTALASEGLRTLAMADKQGASLADAETGLTFLGLVGMLDPPRPEATAAIQTCATAGIRVVMITGDHPVTAEAIARDMGLLQQGRVVSGAELEAMDEAELEQTLDGITVFARVSPAHKLRVVTALQAQGHVVAMTGDGVNDAPALKKADIGIAMGITGTDVAKEAAALTLTDDNFASIVAAVEEGRGIFGNIKKYLMYLLSSNIGEIGLMAGAVLFGYPLPLTAVQILYVNLATDGLPALALAVDPPEPNLMHRKPRHGRGGIFTRPVVTLMLVGGIWSTLCNLGLFAWALSSGRGLEEAMTMTFVSLVLIQFLKAYNFRSDRFSVLRAPFANKWLNWAIAWELVLLLFVVYLPVLHAPFGTFRLGLVDWGIVLGIACTISPVLEAAKWMERRGWLGGVE